MQQKHDKTQYRRAMPSLKSDINVTVSVGDKTLSIGAVLLPNGRYAIKRGRSWAKKIPTATLSEIFTEARKWAVLHQPIK